MFSSRDIPGNEKAISRLQNNLIARGLKIISPTMAPVHVSGHPAQEELTRLYQWTRPHLVLPVHGEARHQQEHARIASECQVPHTLIPQNGQIVRLGPGLHEVVTRCRAGVGVWTEKFCAGSMPASAKTGARWPPPVLWS